jgi:hypothetical protein
VRRDDGCHGAIRNSSGNEDVEEQSWSRRKPLCCNNDVSGYLLLPCRPHLRRLLSTYVCVASRGCYEDFVGGHLR